MPSGLNAGFSAEGSGTWTGTRAGSTSRRCLTKKLAAARQVALGSHVGQVGHEVRDDLEATVLRQRKAVAHRRHSVAAVCISRYVLVYGLDADLNAGAAVGEHGVEVRAEAVIWPRLDGNANAARLGLLRVLDGLGNRRRHVARERVVEAADERVAVVRVQRQEGAAHKDKLYLVHGMAQATQLVDARASLEIWRVSRPDGSHRRRLKARVSLGRVLKV